MSSPLRVLMVLNAFELDGPGLFVWNLCRVLARISHQPSAPTIESSRHPKGIPCSSTLKCEYTS
ncbi:MAG: hypothetical protein SFY68_01000, partial [Candidatus Sumerlaeia bacterium]|nr:hypothetical protein [Candidatus Sumerlaeia bacterium]